MRVVAFCAGTALLVGLLFGVMPALQGDRVLVRRRRSAPTAARVTGGGGTAARPARHRRSRDRGAAAVRRRAAAADADGGRRVRSRLSRRQRALDAASIRSARSIRPPESLQQFLRSGRDRSRRPCPASPASPGPARCRSTSSTRAGLSYEIVGDPPLDERQTADDRVRRSSARRTSRRSICRSSRGARSIVAIRRGSPPVCIVNEAFARSLQGRSPIGLRVGAAAGRGRRRRSRRCARSSASRGR